MEQIHGHWTLVPNNDFTSPTVNEEDFDEDDLNEDWIKTLSWDLWSQDDNEPVETLHDLLTVLNATDDTTDVQLEVVGAFAVLPAFAAAPLQLQHEVALFLDAGDMPQASRVKARAQTLHMHDVGHRPPTSVEAAAKTDFKKIQQQWADQTDALVAQWKDVRDSQIAELQSKIEDAVNAGDIDALASILADTTGQDLIAQHMKIMMENAIVTAKAEAASQGVTMPTLDTTDLATRMDKQAGAVADIMNRSLSNTAATQALTRYGVDNLSGADVASAVGDHLSALSPTYLNDMLGGALTQAQNAGRTFVMSQAPGQYYSSELLDENTCEECEQIDGHDYTTLDDALSDYPTGGYSECLGGPRCRGTIVAVYDEASSDSSDS